MVAGRFTSAVYTFIDRYWSGGADMRIEYEPRHDILNIEFLKDVPIAESLEIEGMIVDYSADKRIVAIEILDIGKRTTRSPLDAIDFSILREKIT
jgi:uncharacterized protein YuzE